MRYLFIHQNFPGQYRHLVAHLRDDPANEVVFLTEREDRSMANVKKIVYKTSREVSGNTHHYLRQVEHAVLRGQAVARVALALKKQGFTPDIMMGHNAWGEILYLKDVFPDVPLLGYFEFFRKPWGGCLDFDPEYPADDDAREKLRTLGSVDLLGLNAADWGQTATEWQRSEHPTCYHDKISVMHDGIDTDFFKPGGAIQRGTSFRFIHVSSLDDAQKNISGLLRAVKTVAEKRHDFTLTIMGGDEGTAQVEALVKLLDLTGFVEITGVQPPQKVMEAMRSSNAFVLFSNREGLPCVLLEAMAMGIPVISTDIPGMEDWVTEETGLLVPRRAEVALAEAMLHLMAEAGKYDKIKIREKIVRECSYPVVGGRIVAAYEAALAAAAKKRS